MELNDEKAREWWMEDLNGELEDNRKNELFRFLNVRPELKAELEALSALWGQLGELPQPDPSPAMDAGFHSMLGGYLAAGQEKNLVIWDQLRSWFYANWQVSLTSLAIGLIGGFLLFQPVQKNSELAKLSSDVSEMKRLVMLTLIEQPQAKDRIKAVNMVEELKNPGQTITEALIMTLNRDPNVNVRLAALEVLTSYGSQAPVREALVRAISRQDSPLMQVALADAMTRLSERSSIEQFENLLDDEKDMDELVRTKLIETIKTLKEI